MRRSLALLAVAALLPIVILAAILGTYGFQNRRSTFQRQAQDHSRFIATLIGHELLANMRAVQIIAQSPSLDGPIDDVRFRLLAKRLMGDQPLWHIISVAGVDGIRIIDTPTPINGIPHGPVVEPDSLKLAVTTMRPTVGPSVAGKSHHIAFAVRAPVIRDGRVLYVVSTIVEPKAMGDLLLGANLPPGWSIAVVDQAGNVVAGTGGMAVAGKRASIGALKALAGPVGWMYHDRSVTGVDEIGTWQPIPNSRWTVHVMVPAAVYKAPMLRASMVLATGLIFSLALAALFVWLLMRELRQQRQREAAATEGQRLEALGRMTGGVAHDFNNLLTPVIGGLDMLRRRLADDSKGLRLVDEALVSAERARMLVSRLLAFSRRQTLETRDVDVGALLTGLRDLIERSIGAGIQLHYRIPPDVLSARVDPAQLELAILNLAVNARDAMPSGGLLTLSVTREADVGAAALGLAPGGYVRINVADTGIGMDSMTQAQAIEPFFTTKAIGKGTGLGLSMVDGLAAQSGGKLLLSSIPGRGTDIDIWLPAGDTPVPVAIEQQDMVDDRKAHLLLVDDHDMVRRATARLLREHGHSLTEARSAEEALELLAGQERFDAIVTDFAMPGQSGVDLAKAARALFPGMPVLLITGFANLSGDELPLDMPRLAKPFRGPELLARVSALLTPNRKAA